MPNIIRITAYCVGGVFAFFILLFISLSFYGWGKAILMENAIENAAIQKAENDFNATIKRSDCVLTEYSELFNEARFRCENEIVRIWIP